MKRLTLILLVAVAVFVIAHYWFQIVAVGMLAFFAFLFYRAMVPKGGPGRFFSRTLPAWIEAVSIAHIARNVPCAKRERIRSTPTPIADLPKTTMREARLSRQLGKDEPWPGELL